MRVLGARFSAAELTINNINAAVGLGMADISTDR